MHTIFNFIVQKSALLIELLLPAQCLVCALKSHNKLICEYCEKKLLATRCYCLHCALPLAINSAYCGDCLSKNYLFDELHALGDYKPPLSTLIKQLKYKQQLIAGELLAKLLTKSILQRYDQQTLSSFDYLLAVPLHPQKLQQRGFNQAQIIANVLHKQLNIPLLNDFVKRKKATIAQEGLSISKRKMNLKDAFSIAIPTMHSLQGKNIIIVDDVVTTGATINSLCEILSNQNIASIHVFCISRTGIDHH